MLAATENINKCTVIFGDTKNNKIKINTNMEDLKQITQIENEKREQYYEFCKLIDQLMTNDDFFTGDISKSAGTNTNKDELK